MVSTPNYVQFNKGGAENDFQAMIARSQEQMYNKLSEENSDLKTCLKQLQKELFEIVDFKTEIFMKRHKAEYSSA